MGFRPFRKKNRRGRRREREREPFREREREPFREREPYRERERYREPTPRPEPLEAQLQPLPGGQRTQVFPPRPTAWGPLTKLGSNLRIQARAGHRAAVVELQPGMYIVAEVPEESLRPQIGVLPLLAPLLMFAANRALNRRMKQQEAARAEVVYEPPPAPRQLPGPTAPAPWLAPEDMKTALSGCGCHHRK